MSSPPHIQHITLITGDVHQSPRSAVSDEVVATLIPLLDSALRGQHTPIPTLPGFTITGGAMGPCCAITLWTAAGETASPAPVPVVTTGVAAEGACGAELWRRLHRMAVLPSVTDPETPPEAPWCAAAVHPYAALQMAELPWIADLERCLAWAWIELPARRPPP